MSLDEMLRFINLVILPENIWNKVDASIPSCLGERQMRIYLRRTGR